MNVPQHLEMGADYARFSPRGNTRLIDAVELVAEAIAFCRMNEISRLLADVRDLVGFTSPTLLDRFLLAEEWASAAKGGVTIALVVKPEHIDPRHFGVVVAADAGLVAETFTTEREAIEWLMKH